MMLGVRLTPDLDRRLTRLSKKTARSKSYYVKEALAEYLNEMEDGYLALQRLNDKNAAYLTTGALKKNLGL